MNDCGHIPPELMERVRGMFLTLFGGKGKLDCWLTRIADELADAGNPAIRPIKLDPSLIPEEFQSVMHRPKEVVDLIVEKLDSLSVFGYTAKLIKQGEASLAQLPIRQGPDNISHYSAAGDLKDVVLERDDGHAHRGVEGLGQTGYGPLPTSHAGQRNAFALLGINDVPII